MRIPFLFLPAAVLSVLLLSACQPDTPPAAAVQVPDLPGATPWTDLQVEDHADTFHFAIVSDRTGGARPGVFAGAMPRINRLSPAFVVSVGDLIEGYTDNQAQLDREWDEIESYVGQLEAPFFYTPGNHDMNNEVMARTWQQRFGPSYYHFLYKDVLFVVLNSELFGMVGAADTPVPGPWQQSEQMAFVAQVLARYPSPRWTIVLLHQPLWDAREINPDWLQVEELLGQRQYTVFAGHFHQYNLARRHDRKFITLATTGGGSGLRGDVYGEFDQVAWVTMGPDGPRIANVVLDGILQEDVSDNALRAALGDISDGIQLQMELASGETFTSSRQLLSISNAGDSPLTVSPGISKPGSFNISGLIPLEVAPGQTVELPLTLAAQQPTPYAELAPAAVDWTLTGAVGERPVQFVHRMAVLPLTRHKILSVADAPDINGDLTDWPELRFQARRQGDVASPALSAEDASFAFDVRADASQLYVAVEVTDDDVQNDANRLPRSQDAITLSIDPRGDAERNRSMGIGEAVLGGDMEKMIVTMLTPGPAAEDKLLPFIADTNAAITAVTVPTSDGYRMEAAVPFSLLSEKAGGEWDALRIAIAIYDLDAGDHSPVQLHWQPYRYGAASIPGSHTFVR